MTAETVGAHFDERGLAVLAGTFDRVADAALDLEHVAHEEPIFGHAVAIGLEADVFDRHGAGERSTHRVLVVFTDEDDGELP